MSGEPWSKDPDLNPQVTIRGMMNKITGLEQRLAAGREELAEAWRQLEAIKTSVTYATFKSLEDQLAEARRIATNDKDDLNSVIADLRAQLAEVRRENEHLKLVVDEQRITIESGEEIQALDAEFEWQKRIIELEQERDRLKTEVARLTTTLADSTAVRNQLLTDLEASTSFADKLEIAKLRAGLQNLEWNALGMCPVCFQHHEGFRNVLSPENIGHKPNCWLSILLKETK